mmetsp:Transcript_38218/g.94610  ORF Transcript_38218/g.94610 Transcript_38218/m.94610 type:complete len:316 (-) Transcript_38218:163-1110(-)
MGSSTLPARAAASGLGPGLLRYSADVRTLCFCAAYYLATASAWAWTVEGVLGLRGLLASIYLTLAAFQGCIAVHNSAHCPPFASPVLNACWFMLISLWNGASATAYIPGHNLGHHRHLQTRSDAIRTSKVNSGSQLWNLLSYFPRVYPSIYKNDMSYFEAQRKLGRPIYAQFQRESLAIVCAYVSLALFGPLRFLALVLIPQVIAKAAIVTLNLLQHDGCDPQDGHNHSRNFTGPILNWFCLNNGYHAIHHMMPGKHWSQLPQLHEQRVASHNHPFLNCPDILGYLGRTFLAPWGRRTNYDGTPYVDPPLPPRAH